MVGQRKLALALATDAASGSFMVMALQVRVRSPTALHQNRQTKQWNDRPKHAMASAYRVAISAANILTATDGTAMR
jgi:hypothetical protein